MLDRPVARWRRADPATRVVLLVALWAVGHVLLLVVSRARALYPYQDDPFEVSAFEGWGRAFAGLAPPGTPVPLRDVPWEYPPAAAVLVVAPALLRGAPYVLGWVGLLTALDLSVLLLLVLVGLRRGSLAGAALWAVAIPLLGPVALARFDVAPAALAVGGLAAATAAPAAAGVLLAAGGAVKLWPALLLPVLWLRPASAGRLRVALGAAGCGAVVLGAVGAYGGLPHLESVLTYQRDRGLELESVPALPLLLARLAGARGISVGFGFGSYQVDGPHAALLGHLATGLLVALVVAVLALAAGGRASPVQLGVLLVAGLLLTDKVLSAQYPVWLVAVVALALARREAVGPVVAPLLLLLLLTQLVYPLAIQDLVAVRPLPVLLLGARDALLLAVLVLAVRGCRAGPQLEHRVPVDEQHSEHAEAGG